MNPSDGVTREFNTVITEQGETKERNQDFDEFIGFLQRNGARRIRFNAGMFISIIKVAKKKESINQNSENLKRRKLSKSDGAEQRWKYSGGASVAPQAPKVVGSASASSSSSSHIPLANAVHRMCDKIANVTAGCGPGGRGKESKFEFPRPKGLVPLAGVKHKGKGKSRSDNLPNGNK